MNPRVKIASTRTPDGSQVVLYKHAGDFLIEVNGQDLMHSRQHESEIELARLGCGHLTDHKAPNILIGGLGMGYTLRQSLDMLRPQARVMVAELLTDVIAWNRDFLGELNGQPIEDQRVDLMTGDVVQLISRSKDRFDAILLDIDNGPNAMTDSSNLYLYSRKGIQSCRRALREKGCLAVWSAETNKKFEQRLMECRFHVRRFRVPAYKGAKSQSRFVWIASESERCLPCGGGEPRLPVDNESKGRRRHTRKRRFLYK